MTNGNPVTLPHVPDLAEAALRNIQAGRAADEILTLIDAGSAAPDALAARLLSLLAAADPEHHVDIVQGFLRPVQKRVEASAEFKRNLDSMRGPFVV
ncbi:hypothetical protein [Burkholderia cepacia]|uniref:hypothetical protein n=1 Tax=Burkholderia cepacia TaxID=292 RepID=UPI000F5FEC37|nr:hypothetical protein [Burkholderia cepacia]RRA01108.1 hypothetical protein DF055_21785 [Burkholderia cepacia]RRA04441.1 hypothetical protein DF054_23700 [Burkholderia cepacia]